ncbi:phosphatidylinositide phosphatase SAC2-like [Mya arenaria]|uniref:phosphatidylinositide phosphatase SAC2-like n=1 Tax=Mya arenaria TaxID=6604 RepID=UPI0022E0CDC5|nr:phosphatidylinositide phosphatase SAC2-like [Mya arenaria]
MEVYQTDNHYIILDGEYSLWCSRRHGTLEPRPGSELLTAWNPVCIGLVYGVVGKIKIHPESEWRLLLVSRQTCVGQLGGEHDVYQINRVALLPLSTTEPADMELDLCAKHHFGLKRTDRIAQHPEGQGKSLQKAWNTMKSAAENVKPKKRDLKDKEKYERRILEELLKMYNETSSFYYSQTHDLTNSIQRQYAPTYHLDLELWTRTDRRFFWNLHMLQEIIDIQPSLSDPSLADHWLVPVIQGSVDIQECVLDFTDLGRDLSPMAPPSIVRPDKEPITYKLILVSRRSRHRAGTRSKKRGLDEFGACANYVETEQIIEFGHHRVSFVQVRGSIPVFWSQTGVKYRPPPKLDKGEAETHEAFRKHIDEQMYTYGSLACVTLTELLGKEKVIGDAYLSHVIKYNSPDITYVTFDFHEYCRGMKFENVSILTSAIKDIIKHTRYCWVDSKGMICEQRGVFRVNCVDCLDRTNVVQTAVARIVMETQCRKLGLLAPEETLPDACRRKFQQMWANTGDAISKQYAGTVALKGDFTRTGERKISGMMKDGVNSANRYYLRFKDTYRQAAIDITHGKPVSEDIMDGRLKVPEDDVRELLEKEENVKQLIEDCKRMLIVEPEECLGGWSLVNADPVSGDPERQEMDVIMLLSQRAVYVAWYDDDEEQVIQYQRIFLEDIERLEIGAEHSLFKSKSIVMRLYYRHFADEGFFHTLRAPGTRLFNNLVIPVKTPEEAKEQLTVVCEAFIAAQTLLKLELVVEEKNKLDKRKTQPHPEVCDIHQQLQENSLSAINLPRDISNMDLNSGSPSPAPSPSLPRRHIRSVQEKREPDADGNKGRLLSSGDSRSKGAMVKSLLSAMPGVNKNTDGNLELSVPGINIKQLNIVGKIKSGSAGAGKLLSKVQGANIFTRHASKTNPQTSDETDVFIEVECDSKTDMKKTMVKERQRTLSRDDSTIDEREITDADLEEEVMLESCGILATNAKQMIQSPRASFEKDENVPMQTADITAQQRDSISFHIGEPKHAFEGKMEDGLLKADIKNEGILVEQRSVRSASFTSSDTRSNEPPSTTEDVWIKRSDNSEQPTVPPNHLSLGRSRVIDNSEADKILAKYSSSKKAALSHPHMRTSMSDSAIGSTDVAVTFENFEPESPKSALEVNFEINSNLQKKLPNLLQSAKMPRKIHRIYDGLKKQIEKQLDDRVCQSTIIFV